MLPDTRGLSMWSFNTGTLHNAATDMTTCLNPNHNWTPFDIYWYIAGDINTAAIAFNHVQKFPNELIIFKN